MGKDTKCCEERRGYLANIPDNEIGVRPGHVLGDYYGSILQK